MKDIMAQFGDEKGQELLREMNEDPFEKKKKQVREMFNFLNDNDIEEILKKHNNSVDNAFEDFMIKNQEEEDKRRKEKEVEQERQRKEQNNKFIEAFVRNFKMFSQKEIEEVFSSNENDPGKTSKKLYEMMKEREKQNEEAMKMKREMDIQNIHKSKKTLFFFKKYSLNSLYIKKFISPFKKILGTQFKQF